MVQQQIMAQNFERAFIALGANISWQGKSPLETLVAASKLIGLDDEPIPFVSKFYRTPCFPEGAGPDYINAILVLSTARSARRLLDDLHEIEDQFGRQREQRWGQRTLDLDLLALGDQILPDNLTLGNWVDLPQVEQRLRAPDELILPHPRLHERAFVLVPLMDVAPDWVHPLLNLTTRQMHDALSKEALDDIIPVDSGAG